MKLKMTIRPARFTDVEKLVDFTDKNIGKGYYSQFEIEKILKGSSKGSINCSFVLVQGSQILGIRFTLLPGHWGLSLNQITPDQWPISQDHVAYFKSLFVDQSVQHQGWGSQLSQISIEELKRAGIKAAVCHSWKESPDDSSKAYLKKMGFSPVAEHPRFWEAVNYQCPLCTARCQCTAVEMIKVF